MLAHEAAFWADRVRKEERGIKPSARHPSWDEAEFRLMYWQISFRVSTEGTRKFRHYFDRYWTVISDFGKCLVLFSACSG